MLSLKVESNDRPQWQIKSSHDHQKIPQSGFKIGLSMLSWGFGIAKKDLRLQSSLNLILQAHGSLKMLIGGQETPGLN